MRIQRLTLSIIRVPLKRPFKHASAVRDDSDNLVVACELEDGTVGWGEGVPRAYVTGDTPASSLDLMHELRLAQRLTVPCTNWTDVVRLIDRFADFRVSGDSRGCRGNPLRAAVELSLLDAYGQVFQEPLMQVAGVIPEARDLLRPASEVTYSTTIDAEASRRLWKSALKMRLYGFRQCKVKVGSDQADASRMATIRLWIGSAVDLRVDANEAWSIEDCVERIDALLPFAITAVEQPVPHAQSHRLAELRSRIPVPIMFDESLTSMSDLEQMIATGSGDLLNLRISKCGGWINCLRMAAKARAHGLGYQLGCHPGETGILSAAGRQWAQVVRDIRYCEGSYDRHILRQNITTPDITFRYGGRAAALDRPGLGVRVDPSRLSAITLASQTFDVH